MTIDEAITLLTHAKKALGGSTPFLMEDGCTEYYTEFGPALRAAKAVNDLGEPIVVVVFSIEDQPSITGEGDDAELETWVYTG